MRAAFYQSGIEHPHLGRARALLKAHPEIRQLMVRNPWTALIATSILVMQTGIAFGMGQLGESPVLVGAVGQDFAEGHLRLCQLRHATKNAPTRRRIASQRSIRCARTATA